MMDDGLATMQVSASSKKKKKLMQRPINIDSSIEVD
jgi:hypothetical protein